MHAKLGDLKTALTDLARPCWRKERHKSKGAAEAHMRSILARKKSKDESRINVYECRDCIEDGQRGWHVGHKGLRFMEERDIA